MYGTLTWSLQCAAVRARFGALGVSLERLGVASGEVVGVLARSFGVDLEAWLGIPADGRVVIGGASAPRGSRSGAPMSTFSATISAADRGRSAP